MYASGGAEDMVPAQRFAVAMSAPGVSDYVVETSIEKSGDEITRIHATRSIMIQRFYSLILRGAENERKDICRAGAAEK